MSMDILLLGIGLFSTVAALRAYSHLRRWGEL